MNYQELKESHRARLQAFPLEWAFDNAQLDAALERLNATREDVCSVPSGGIIVRKVDVPALHALMASFDAERKAAFEDAATLEDAIHYELGNHEYCITGDPEPALAALGYTLDEIKADPKKLECFVNALRRRHREDAI